MISDNLKSNVTQIVTKNRRLSYSRIEDKQSNRSILTEANGEIKILFYEKLDDMKEKIYRHDITVALEDFSAKIGKNKDIGHKVRLETKQ